MTPTPVRILARETQSRWKIPYFICFFFYDSKSIYTLNFHVLTNECKALGLLVNSAKDGDKETVERICRDREVNVNELLDIGGVRKAALHLAASHDRLGVLQVLIDHGADIEVKSSPNGWTPIHEAVELRHLDIVKALVARHADVNIPYPNGMTPLYKAVYYENLVIASFLQEHGAAVDSDRATHCLPRAAARPRLDVVQFLVNHGADINDPNTCPLGMATRHKRINNVKYLVDRGADVDIQDIFGYVPAQIAAACGWVEGLRYFMEEVGVRGDLNWKDAAFELFLGSEDSQSAATVEYLIDNGFIDVDTQDSAGATLLYRAWERGRTCTVNTLLAKTSNPISRSRTGETIWDLARMAGKPKLLDEIENLASEKKFPAATSITPCRGHGKRVPAKDIPKSGDSKNAGLHKCWSWLNIRTTEVKYQLSAERNVSTNMC